MKKMHIDRIMKTFDGESPAPNEYQKFAIWKSPKDFSVNKTTP